MASIKFGYKNHCLASGVAFTPSTEAADFDADNLGKAHPAEWWRMTSLPGNVLIDFGTGQTYDLVAPIYVSASPHRNLLEESTAPNNWTASEATGSEHGNSDFDPLPTGWKQLVAGIHGSTNNTTHYLQTESSTMNTTLKSVAPSSYTLRFAIWVEATVSDTNYNLRLYFYAPSTAHSATIDIDVGNLSVNSTSKNGSLDTANVQAVADSGPWTRIEGDLTFGLQTGPVGCRVYYLDNAFADTFAGTGSASNAVYFLGPHLELRSANPKYWDVTPDGEQAGFWHVQTNASSNFTSPFSDSGHVPLVASARPDFWPVTVFSSYHELSAVSGLRYVKVFFEDIQSQLDVSNIFVGPSYQPSKTIKYGHQPLTVGPDGTRILRGTLENVPEADIFGEIEPMMHECGVGMISSQKTASYPAVQYRTDRKPVLVIIDPAETDYEQEEMLYGYINRMDVVSTSYNTTLAAYVYRVDFEIEEVLPGG